MDLSDVRGKPYPQKVTLDCNIGTVTGELISKGTSINVLLFERLITCTDRRNHDNVEQTTRPKRLYLNPNSKEAFQDIHCSGKVYNSVDLLFQDSPRYFLCKKGFFTMDINEHTVKIEDGHQFEITMNKDTNTYSINENTSQQTYANVAVRSSTIMQCRCLTSGRDVQIVSSCKSSFQCNEDPTHYTPVELLCRFPLPRQVKIADSNLHQSKNLGSGELYLEEHTKKFYLLFTLDYKVAEEAADILIKDKIKCCVLEGPSDVKIKSRIDNSQFGERFDSVLLFEFEQNGRPFFSVLGRKTVVPVSRQRSGRENYMDMSLNKSHNQSSLCDSGFSSQEVNIASPVSKHLSGTVIDASNRFSNQDTYLSAVDSDSGDSVNLTNNNDSAPLIPRRLYLKEENISDLTESQHAQSITNIQHKSVKPESSNQSISVSTKPMPKRKSECTLHNMTCKELSDLFKNCKLDKLATLCLDQAVDGELFMSLSDEMFEDDPFLLNKLEILKVGKIKKGWRPK